MPEEPKYGMPIYGMDEATQKALRVDTCWFIRNLSNLVKCDCDAYGRCAAAATVLCQKFFLRSWANNHLIIASACLMIVKRNHSRYDKLIEDICNYSYLLIHSGDPIPRLTVPYSWKDNLFFAENLVLHALMFQVHVDLPHDILLRQRLFPGDNMLHALFQLLNDGLLTLAYLRWEPKHLVAGAIYAGMNLFNFSFMLSDYWWQEYGLNQQTLQEIAEMFSESQQIKQQSYFTPTMKDIFISLSDQNEELSRKLADANKEIERLTEALKKLDPST